MEDTPNKPPKTGSHKKGTVMRGPDGRLYFIPTEALEQFRVPHNKGAWVKDLLGAVSEAPEVAGQIGKIYDWTKLRITVDAVLSGVTLGALADDQPTKGG